MRRCSWGLDNEMWPGVICAISRLSANYLWTSVSSASLFPEGCYRGDDGSQKIHLGSRACLGRRVSCVDETPVQYECLTEAPGTRSCCTFEGHSFQGHCSGAQVTWKSQSAAESCQAKSSHASPASYFLDYLWYCGDIRREGKRTGTGVQVGTYEVSINLSYSFWVISLLASFCWLWVLLAAFLLQLELCSTAPNS